MKVRCPTKGSFMILKASAANGSSSEGFREVSDPSPRIDPHDGRNVHGGREVVDHRVEQRLDALVPEGGAADDRGELQADRRGPDGRRQLRRVDLPAQQVLFQQLVVDVGDRLEQLLPRRGDPVGHVGGNRLLVELRPQGVLFPDDGAHLHQVDDPPEAVLFPEGKLDRDRVGRQPFPHHPDHAVEIGARCGPSCSPWRCGGPGACRPAARPSPTAARPRRRRRRRPPRRRGPAATAPPRS